MVHNPKRNCYTWRNDYELNMSRGTFILIMTLLLAKTTQPTTNIMTTE